MPLRALVCRLLLLGLASTVSACLSDGGRVPGQAGLSATPSATSFRSNVAYMEAPLPPGWAAAEGPQSLARPFTGLVAFNSWGQVDFWAPEISTGSGRRYDAATVMQQMPVGGAYIVLVDQTGGPAPIPELYRPEYQPADLSGLWSEQDCRGAAGGPNWKGFYKWGRYLILEVFCQPTASDVTAAAVNALLAGWQFDRVPVGDTGWATVTARGLLPAAVGPGKFPIVVGPAGTQPAETSQQHGNELRATKTQLSGVAILVAFTYYWGIPELADTPTGPHHWWQYEARPNVDVVLIAEGGDGLPSPTVSSP